MTRTWRRWAIDRMDASELYLIAGTDRDGNVWIARSEDAATAAHVADLFRDREYTRVTITPPGTPLDLD